MFCFSAVRPWMCLLMKMQCMACRWAQWMTTFLPALQMMAGFSFGTSGSLPMEVGHCVRSCWVMLNSVIASSLCVCFIICVWVTAREEKSGTLIGSQISDTGGPILPQVVRSRPHLPNILQLSVTAQTLPLGTQWSQSMWFFIVGVAAKDSSCVVLVHALWIVCREEGHCVLLVSRPHRLSP